MHKKLLNNTIICLSLKNEKNKMPKLKKKLLKILKKQKF